MTKGRVYLWEADASEFIGGRVRLADVPLAYLDPAAPGQRRLSGRFVEIVNAGRLPAPNGNASSPTSTPIGDATPNALGDFLFDPAAGGPSPSKMAAPSKRRMEAMISASHFGEVNAYYHITRMAERIDALLAHLGERPLPKVRALVNAYEVSALPSDQKNGSFDSDGRRWFPVSGASYRCHGESVQAEAERSGNGAPTVRCRGEIWLEQGAKMTRHGWLPRIAGAKYRCNTAHIAGQLYRYYALHLARYTADFRANGMKPPASQDDVATLTATALSDYWAATMLGTPHVWCWHRRHDSEIRHARSLASDLTLATLQERGRQKGESTATVLAAALWDLRRSIEQQGDDACDLLVLAAQLAVRRLLDDPYKPDRAKTRALRRGFPVFAACLLHADARHFGGRYAEPIRKAMAARGIAACDETLTRLSQPCVPPLAESLNGEGNVAEHAEKIRLKFAEAVIPADDELIGPDRLEAQLCGSSEALYDLAVVGDVMTGMRMRHRLNEFGPDYALAWVKPIVERTTVMLGNQEGPFAEGAEQEDTTRNFSYKVDPRSAATLRRGGFQAMTIANNHLMDCGRDGVRETIATLEEHGIEVIGGGLKESEAHRPAIFETRGGRIGLLGYYWNRRTAARGKLPGSARDLPELVARDIAQLKPQVDHVVVTVHWGIPYEREPLPEDRMKARHFIDCGADAVIGHHPHIIQPLEIYRGRPIFYSVGNFAFGSGNSRAESIMVCLRFDRERIKVEVFPLYVQNRDPRLDYQPKVLGGAAAAETLARLASISGADGDQLTLHEFHASLDLTMTPQREASAALVG